MAASAVGVIFSNIHDENIPELSRHRTMASIPYGGRYRLIDFALSNMVNSGITTVGIVTKYNYQSLIDHLGSGKDWDLARKDGGIILLPPYSDETDAPYSNRLEALKGITGFLNRRKEDYVVISDCDGVARMDISDIVQYHIEKNADITMVYHEEENVQSSYFITLDADQSGSESLRKRNGVKQRVFAEYHYGRDLARIQQFRQRYPHQKRRQHEDLRLSVRRLLRGRKIA